MPDDAEGGAFAHPEVRTLPVGGNEVLRLALDRLRSALTHHDGSKRGETNSGDDASNHGL